MKTNRLFTVVLCLTMLIATWSPVSATTYSEADVNMTSVKTIRAETESELSESMGTNEYHIPDERNTSTPGVKDSGETAEITENTENTFFLHCQVIFISTVKTVMIAQMAAESIL